MTILQSKPGDCPSINVAGVEYSPDATGHVEIVDVEHVAVAKREGFTEVAPRDGSTEVTHNEGE